MLPGVRYGRSRRLKGSDLPAPRPYTKNAGHFSRRALRYRLRAAAAALRLYPPALARRLRRHAPPGRCSLPQVAHLDAPGHQGQAAVAAYGVTVHFALKALRFMRAAVRFAACP